MRHLRGGWGCIAFLALALPSPGQITSTSPYRSIVATRLNSARWLVRAVQDSNDNFTADLIRAARSGEAWQEAQDKVGRGLRALVKLLQSKIATDKYLLDHLQRSPNAPAIDTVAGNLEPRVIAESLSALSN
jgi:hypothetical protein